MKKTGLIIVLLTLMSQGVSGQEIFTLKKCIDYAVENNHTLQKSKLDRDKAVQARREITGALLPQINGSGSITYNIQKTTFAMPNFMNDMLPEQMRDPNAPKYMTITMGMNYAANIGASLMQQVLNFSLFNAVDISKSVQKMADIGYEIGTDDVIAQTATIFYNIQVLGYALDQFDTSLNLMDKTIRMMEVNRADDIVRQVDLDRIKVTKANLETQKDNIRQARDVQKNLLKLQMGFDMNDDIEIQRIDIRTMEEIATTLPNTQFNVSALLPYRLIREKTQLTTLQHRSAKYETLPTLTFVANYAQNFMSDEFFRGETYHRFPVSMLSLNLKVPIFSGLSKRAKVKQADIEISKASQDELQLEQSLAMGHANAMMQLENSLKNIIVQRGNKQLAEDVYNVTDNNFKEGICPLSDVLNASSSLIQSQISYVEALNNYMKAYIDIKKADGTIRDIVK
ncbi:MAG: TolC family protein [Bacteroidales bacterium]|nr:TolC family protein [Bacteroidales bacterium]